ncbi:carbohydrate kinase family protein [Salinimicrobium sp. TIG7-5_MAKvit]|uniref:carbohydrate kinase family protein n=1 Tax=Salinimicrobium sp. TIG7-5_MAKvit TaxID=3121289 RepID=UPI003C6DD2DA
MTFRGGALDEFDHFHLSNFFLQKGIKPDILEIFKKAKAAGLTTSLDLQVDPEDKWDFDYKKVLPYVDIFFPNQSELLNLTKKDDLEEAILALKPEVNIVAIKMGTEGSLLVSGDERIIERPFINRHFKDAIGAGDSFNAGFIHEYLKGSSWKACLKNGNLMGSLNTTCAGGTTAFTTASEIALKKQQIENKEL